MTLGPFELRFIKKILMTYLLLSSGCTVSQFSTIHLSSLFIAARMITTGINVRANKDSIGLQILQVFHMESLSQISMVLTCISPVNYSLHLLWSGAHSLLVLHLRLFASLAFSLMRVRSNRTLRYGKPCFLQCQDTNNAWGWQYYLRGANNAMCDVSLHYPRQRYLDYDK